MAIIFSQIILKQQIISKIIQPLINLNIGQIFHIISKPTTQMLLSKLRLLTPFSRSLTQSIKYSFSMGRRVDEIINQYTFNINPDELIYEKKRPLKRTKIVCTIGPCTEAAENALKLVEEGMNVARLNFSHGDHAEKRRQMVGAVDAANMMQGADVAIMLDTKGPEIRTGLNQNGKPIFVKKGQLLQITNDYSFLGNEKRISCSYHNLARTTGVGKKVLIADGTVIGVVKSIQSGVVTIEVMNDGKIGEKKNMCLPGSSITLDTITQVDKIDIVNFGLKYQVDQIAVSFARRGSDLTDLRKMLTNLDPTHGPNISLVAKIENHQAIQNLEDIIDAADKIMVARGDLGMELPMEKIILAQKYIIDRCLRAGKPVITATQMLESMESRVRPSRAEISDVTNAVLDLADCTMLSGETANGLFPKQSVETMRKIIQEGEHACDYQSIFDDRKVNVKQGQHHFMSAVGMSFYTRCQVIMITIRENYRIVEKLSTWRPKAHICVFTDNPKVRKALASTFGVRCFKLSSSDNKHQIFEEFLNGYGHEYADNKRIPERALFIGVDERNGFVTSHEVIRA